MRSQKELILATKPWAVEDPATTWRLLTTTFLAEALTQVAIVMAPWWPLKALLGVIAGLIWVRVFIFFHDWLHKAIFLPKASPLGATLGRWVMTAVGLVTLVPPTVWQQTHDYHHQNNAKMVGASIGSYPLITVGMYKALSPKARMLYGLVRHPINILLAYFTVFLGGMCVSAFKRAPAQHWQGLASPIVHFGTVGLVSWYWSFSTAFFSIVWPMMVACTAGAYLFYAQHNFPDIKLKGRKEWSYAYAALHSSSMMDMPDVLHWFTGNIGYHHVHHLNHKIPFYKLHLAMDGVPELQDPGRTSWAPSDVMACLRLKLWDPELDRMVTWAEAAEKLEAKPVAG